MADRAEIVADIVKCKEASSDSSVIVRASRLAKWPGNIAASDGVVAIGPAPICPDPDVSAAAAAPLKGPGSTVRTLCRPEVFIGDWLKVMPEVIRQGMHVELPLAVRSWETPEHFWNEVSWELHCVRVSDTCGFCDVVLASLRVGVLLFIFRWQLRSATSLLVLGPLLVIVNSQLWGAFFSTR